MLVAVNVDVVGNEKLLRDEHEQGPAAAELHCQLHRSLYLFSELCVYTQGGQARTHAASATGCVRSGTKPLYCADLLSRCFAFPRAPPTCLVRHPRQWIKCRTGYGYCAGATIRCAATYYTIRQN